MPDQTATKTAEPRELHVIENDRQLCMARFSPCGKYLFAGDYNAGLRRWDVTGEEPKPLETLRGHRGWLQNITFAPRGEQLYAADSWGRLCAWTVGAEPPRTTWCHEQAHDGWVRSLAVSQDGQLLATAGADAVVRVWSAVDGKLLHELSGHKHEVYSVGIHPDGKGIVSGDLMGELRHWDLSTGQLARAKTIEPMHVYDNIQDVTGLRILQFHDDGQTLLCAGSDPTRTGRTFGIPTLRFLNWKTLEETEVRHLGPAKDGYVYDISLHGDGYFMLVTSGPPGAGRVIFTRRGEEEPFYSFNKLYNTHSLALHPDGRRYAVVSTNKRSGGNGAVKDKEGDYLGNNSPLHIYELPATA